MSEEGLRAAAFNNVAFSCVLSSAVTSRDPDSFCSLEQPGIHGFLGEEMGCILRLSQFQGRNKGNSC